jgi:hypothetical protein
MGAELMNMRKTVLLGVLLLFGAAACDLEVTNPNQPETDRVLATPADVESLILSSVNTWWDPMDSYLGLRPLLSTMAFQHSATAANFGMVDFSVVPLRPAVNNTPAYGFASYLERSWYRSYRAISGASDGLRQMDAGVVVSNPHRARAIAKLTQGLSHGMLAVIYDQAFVFDETMDPIEEQELKPYTEVRDAALAYLDEAISIATANTFTGITAGGWLGRQADYNTNTDVVRLARAYKAYFRAAVARTPQEAEDVNWAAVIEDIDNGITADFAPIAEGWTTDTWQTGGMYYTTLPGAWSQVNNMVLGMADQSGGYQNWMSQGWGASDRQPFVIVTPDRRFPQGSTVEEQTARDAEGNPLNRGVYIEFPHPDYSLFGAGVGGQRGRPDRGTWRWSNYRDYRYDYMTDTDNGPLPQLTVRQLQLLKAEALYMQGDLAGAAAIINVTRADPNHAALNATDAAGTNTDCVPRLPDGTCGDLWEMLKWEKRLETYHVGLGAWYFDGRRWGDLMQGSFLHLPVPGRELEVLEMPYYTFGGAGGIAAGAAPIGTYGY